MLLTRIELVARPYQGRVLPLYYRSVVSAIRVELVFRLQERLVEPHRDVFLKYNMQHNKYTHIMDKLINFPTVNYITLYENVARMEFMNEQLTRYGIRYIPCLNHRYTTFQHRVNIV